MAPDDLSLNHGGRLQQQEDEKVQPEIGEDQEKMDETAVPDGGWGWLVVFAAFYTSAVIGGITYTYGVILPSLVVHFNATRATIGGIGSLMLGLQCIVGPLASVINNRFGCRKTSVLGTVMATFGLLSSSFAPNVPFLYFSFGIVTGIGLGVMYIPAIVVISMYFERRRGLANGLMFSGAGVGTITFAPLATYLLEVYSWRGAMLVEAGLVLNGCACGMIFVPVSSVQSPARRRKLSLTVVVANKPNRGFEADVVNYLVEIDESTNDCKQSLADWPPSCVREESFVNCGEPISGSTRVENGLEGANRHTVDDFMSNDDDCNKQQFLPADKPGKRLSSSYEECASLEKNDASHCDVRCMEKEREEFEKPKEEKSQNGRQQQETGEAKISWTRYFDISLFKDHLFLIFLVSGLLVSVSYGTPYVYLPDLAQVDVGIDEDRSALLISVVGVSNTVIRGAFGFIADLPCVNRMVSCFSVLIVGGIANMCVVYCRAFWMLLVYSTIFGFCTGTYTSLVPVVLVDLFGVSRLANSYGIYLFCIGVGSMAATPFAGWLFDITQSYNSAFLFTGLTMAASGLALVALMLLKRCRHHHYRRTDKTLTEQPG